MMLLSQVLLRSLRFRGDHPAIIEEGRVITWREFVQRVSGFARLLKDLGVKSGDRVGMLSDNDHRYLEAFFASPWSGAIFVPLNSRLALPEIEGIVVDAGVEILIADARHADKAAEIKARLPQLRHLVFASDDAAPSGWTISRQRFRRAWKSTTRDVAAMTWRRSIIPAAPPAGPRG